MNKTRIAGLAAGAALVLGFASPAAAQTMTVAQLQAQIQALMAQLSAMQGGSTVSAGYTFNTDLTVGSTGADVTALQSLLISKGFLTMPAGVAEGYFGALTQSAVAKWQASAGISPAVGYFGPKSRAAVNAMGGTTTTTTTTTTTGTTGTVSTTGSITTPGQEGILTVTAGPISNTVTNVGSTMVPVLAVRAQAQNSDIAIQRITVDLGTNTQIYNKVFNKLYVVDKATGNVLTSEALNGTTVVQSGNNYIATLTGFSDVVPQGTYKDLIVEADLNSSIDSSILTGSWTFTVDQNGVRGIDGAGIDSYGPSATQGISQSITVNKSLVDNAQAQLAIAPSTPLANSIAVTDTVNGQYLQLPIFAFNLTAQNDAIHIHNLAVAFNGVPSAGLTTATATAAYLYNGSTQVASASINSSTGIATFSNITDGTAGATVPAGTTVTYTVKADVTGITSGSLGVTGATGIAGTGYLGTNGGSTFYNSQDSSVVPSGTAVGNLQTVLGKGPVFTLLSTSITKGQTSGGANGTATSTLNATFNIQVQAIGTSVLFGSDGSTTGQTFTFGLYNPNSITTTYAATNASTTSIGLPSSGVTIDTVHNSFTLPQNNTIVLPVTYQFVGNSSGGVGVAIGNYAVGLEKIQWVTGAGQQSTTYTSGQVAWRTSPISLP
jgi:hypothetical protein